MATTELSCLDAMAACASCSAQETNVFGSRRRLTFVRVQYHAVTGIPYNVQRLGRMAAHRKSGSRRVRR